MCTVVSLAAGYKAYDSFEFSILSCKLIIMFSLELTAETCISHRHCGLVGSKVGWGGQEARKHTDEISGPHGSEYEDDCLLGCCAVQPGSTRLTVSRPVHKIIDLHDVGGKK
jgi:hypothetical protein